MGRLAFLGFVGSGLLGAIGCAADPGVTAATGGAGAGTSGSGGRPGRNGGSGGDIAFTGLGGTSGGGGAAATRPPVSCQNLDRAEQDACPRGMRTTVSGTVYDPAGKVPLYNVVVYAPSAPLASIATGPSCDTCESPVSGKPVAATLTDTKGNFRFAVPACIKSIVIQIGKWRREVPLPNLVPCAENAITDRNLTRLPRNQSEGHMPRIALTTGGADALQCFLRRIGIDDAEFTPEAGKGRVNFYSGLNGTTAYAPQLNGGAVLTQAPMLWSSLDALKKYDILMLSCEGAETLNNKSPAARQAVQDYANVGGRVFASHWHNQWLWRGPAPFSTVATFMGRRDLPSPITVTIDTSFPKGAAMAEWLVNVGGSATLGPIGPPGDVPPATLGADVWRRWSPW